MRALTGILWLLAAVVLVALAIYLSGIFGLTDRLTALFFLAQPWLPLTWTFEQFLIVLTVASLLLTVLTVAGAAAAGSWWSVRHQRKLGAVTVARRDADHVREQHRQQYDQLGSLGQALSERLDKRALVQNIIEAASRLTSVAQASSVVSLWLLHFETDTFRFERGFYCDETMFTKTAFAPNELPFSRVVTTHRSTMSIGGEEGSLLVKREKLAQLRVATGLLLVPLVIENTVLGVLVVWCHPEVVKDYGQRSSFYSAVWAELTLALAVAVQGEVAILDRLTGVHNRTYLLKRLIEEIERANRYQLPLSLLMIDIDDFKLVNDTLGHPQGDAVLKIMAKLIRKAVRAIDLVGRYGGEEFIIMLPETGYGDETGGAGGGAPVVAERIRSAVDEEFRGLQKPLNLTVSVGVACRRFPEDRATDYQDLIRIADQQLYRAKTTGKNKVCTFMPEKPQTVA